MSRARSENYYTPDAPAYKKHCANDTSACITKKSVFAALTLAHSSPWKHAPKEIRQMIVQRAEEPMSSCTVVSCENASVLTPVGDMYAHEVSTGEYYCSHKCWVDYNEL